eukprot:TRINITY_DN32663_c0_g1_i1.p1 TRINITY_DN32663_c0_g1~~TRINITY_DN32663_c0_g1_i1.p1  ORF type:complete len:555 (-),score=96.94 TRINITY_DN32663_c0_g1_i1:676-2271(-)
MQPSPPPPPARRSVAEERDPISWNLEVLQAPSGGGGHGLLRPDGCTLLVGRTVQPPEYWQQLIPDESARNSVSREHFKISFCAQGVSYNGCFKLQNMSRGGTWLNGSLIHGEAEVAAGDAVGCGGPDLPVVLYRLVVPTALRSPATQLPPQGPDYVLVATPKLGSSSTALTLELTSREPLRVGRALQPPDFWAKLIPDESLRGAVSREHFEISTAASGEVRLRCLGNLGLLCNGLLLEKGNTCHLGLDDELAIPRPAEAVSGDPIAFFCLRDNASLAGRQPPAQLSTKAAAAGGAVAVLPGKGDGAAEDAHPSTSCSPPRKCGNCGERDAASVVKISLGALPAPFRLECTSVRGISEAALKRLPRDSRIIEASCINAEVRVGRNVQPQPFWEVLVPDEGMRNAVSREHFEVILGDEGLLTLRNLSGAGTLVNGKRIHDYVRVEPGDFIGVGAAPNEPTPAAVFQLRCFDLENDGSEIDGGMQPGALPPTILHVDAHSGPIFTAAPTAGGCSAAASAYSYDAKARAGPMMRD